MASANAQLQEVDRLKTDFLSMVSHELRTPLTAIIGYTDLLLRGTHGGLNERQHRHQIAVRLGAQRLLAVINDLLDVARLESGLVQLERSPVSLASVFDEAVGEVRQSAADAHLNLRIELPSDLPPVLADGARLVQVLSNLLANAVKFTPAGGSVALCAEWTAGDRIQLSVRDTGAGIAAEHLAHIWDRFYQADSSVRRRYSGTGLGLSIVRGLVELHGGSITATSPGQGQGACFSFDLPLQVVEDTAVSVDTPAPADRTPASGGRPSILVVEDEPDNRELLATMLPEILPVQVVTVGNGIDALEEAERAPDLILLDLVLPGLSGFEVVRRLKANEHTRHIPVVALTALTRPAERDEAVAAGCDGLIFKPFDTDELIQLVSKHLGIKISGAG